MGDQFFRAWAFDPAKLDALVGSGDKTLAKKVTRKSQLLDDVRGMIEHGTTVEDLLDEILDGDLKKDHAYKYRRLAEVVLDRVAKKLSPEATKPGRGWQSLAPAWKHWKHPAIAKVWTSVSPWPWRTKSTIEWPRLLVVARSDLAALAADVAAFDENVVVEKAVPKTVPRFGEGEWPMDELAGELSHLMAAWKKWIAAAQKQKLALAIWHDGDS